jgi:hypothetical protein
MADRLRKVLESAVVVAILLVLVQTFLEDVGAAAGWPWPVRRVLIYTGFGFDVFFTIEFLARLYVSVWHRRAGEYVFHERGWIDFAASIPLLMLSSGPQVAALVLGRTAVVGAAGILNVLKVVKAVRIARVLRLLRVLKIFRQIKYADARMAQRHIATITTIAVTGFIFAMLVGSLLGSAGVVPGLDRHFQRRMDGAVTGVVTAPTTEQALALAEYESLLLILKEDGETRYTRYDNDYYRRFFGPADYQYRAAGDYGLFFDLRPLAAQQSRETLIVFGAVILVVIVILTSYSPHFAITVSDPIHVMRRGMAEPEYNLAARIPPRYEDDEVFQLASLYNEQFLPMKDREAQKAPSGASALTMDDVAEALREEE